jgi:eukaryotic-like serine/threonine-protein kinase
MIQRVEDQVAAKRSDSAAPPVMGKYAPFARLGHGGMADVFLAVARGPVGFNKLAVVKRLRNPDDASRVEMFLDEARLSARLSHPNIVNTYEVGEAKGQYFLAMEYLDGQSVQAVLTNRFSKGTPLDPTIAAFIAMQTLKGLHYAHELTDYDGSSLHVVHRDVSPQNVFITYQGEVKLLDFGIAKAALNATHTETGVLKGKIRYMAPEQIEEKNVDRRADVFALGIVLWEMLVGRALYRGDVSSILQRIAKEEPPLVRTLREEISPELEAIVAKALQRDLTKRYATADAMRADLEQALRGKQDGADASLARLLNETFAETRDAVRSRIKTFLAEAPVITDSGPNLIRAAELPSLFGDSGGGSGGSGSGGSGVSGSGSSRATGGSNNAVIQAPLLSEARPIRSGSSWLWGAAGALIFVAIGIFAFRRSHAVPPPAATPAALPTPAPVPAPTTTPVHVETSPAGALVEWNGRPLARTPADVQLPAGSQTLKISRDGYEPQDVTLDVHLREPTGRAVVLRPKIDPVPSATATGSHATHHSADAPHPTPAPAAAKPAPAASASRPKIRVVDDDAP